MSASVIEQGTNVEHTPLEYVYVTIPAEYVCVYHRILAMLADYGIDMLKDCKATCTEKNSGVIECFNMFNAAVAARKLGDDSLANTLIKYIKAKINQIYKGKDNSTSFVFPVDENGELKAFVSCGERPTFFINPDDGELYEHKLNNGKSEHFHLGKEDGYDVSQKETNVQYEYNTSIPSNKILNVFLIPKFEIINNVVKPCVDLIVIYNGYRLNLDVVDYDVYINDTTLIDDFEEVEVDELYKFSCIVRFNGLQTVKEEWLRYENTDI